MNSPLTEIRKRLGLNQRNFAILCRTTASTVSNIECRLQRFTGSMIEMLNELGLDGERLSEEQDKCIESHRQELIKQIRERNAKESTP